MSPDAVRFNFRGSPITVEIYAPYSANLETDPTGDSSQLVSSQTIDFSEWNKDLPIPLAPRWNVRDESLDGSNKPIPSRFRPDPRVTNFKHLRPAR